MGDAVDGAGDINGDGWDDLLLGAYQNDGANLNSGAAYILYGPLDESGDVDDLADVTFENDNGAAGDFFGHSLLGDLDINGDGTGDVVIGGDLHDGGGVDAGSVFVYLDGPRGSLTPADADHWYHGEDPYAYLGHNTRRGGDVNGDGYEDFLACAPSADLNAENAGAAYLMVGPLEGSGLIGSYAEAVFEGENEEDEAGHDARGAGDLTGDGRDDVLVDIRHSDGNGANAGAITYWMSPLSGRYVMSDAYATRYGQAGEDGVGIHIGTPGDVNGDDVPDVATGAWRNDAVGSNAGAAYLLYGPPEPGASVIEPDARFTGEAAGDGAGFYVSGGDANDDGLGDFVAGSMYSQGSAGRFYLFLGQQ
jgi:hypothetical protein